VKFRVVLVAGMAVVLGNACSKTLSVGQGPLDPEIEAASNPGRCNAPGKPVPQGRTVGENLSTARALLVGHWFACPGSALPPDVPAAIEFTEERIYFLNDLGGGAYERVDQGSRYNTAWSLSTNSLEIGPYESWHDGGAGPSVQRDAGMGLSSSYGVLFDDEPLRLTWLPSEARFLKR
jgi:hypothetical protein